MSQDLLFRTILPPEVLVDEMDPRLASPEALWSEERAALGAALPRRQREHAAGRILAHRLLDRLGAAAQPLLAAPDRTPRWPEGFVGSIAHCETLAVVAVARAPPLRGLGLDVEPALPLPEGVAELVLGAHDQPWSALGPPADRLAFCAKEAFYKALFPLTRTFLDFGNVSVRFDADRFVATLRLNAPPFSAGTQQEGRWICDGAHLGAAVVIGHPRSLCYALPGR